MPPAPKSQAAELLELLVARAPALIAAGVTSLSIEGLSATLAPPAPVAEKPTKAAQPAPRSHIDPMRDPSTYPGGRVPGYTREDVPG